MIQSFRHKGLKRLYEKDDSRGVAPEMLSRIRSRLARLDIADSLEDLDLPGYRLHPLKGNLRGFWAIDVSGNWRMVFRFKDGDVFDLDLTDYH